MADLFNLHPEVKRRLSQLQQWCRESGVRMTVTSGFRSVAQQSKLYAAAKAGQRTLPAAPPGQSTHNYGFAFDAVFDPPDALPQVADVAECFGLVWAGKRDPVHFDVFGFEGWQRVLRGQDPGTVYHC